MSDILCPEMSEQITCFLLPSLADPSAQFPFKSLLETLLMMLSKTDDSGKSNKGVNPTPWLLFGVLAFVEKQLGTNECACFIRKSIRPTSFCAGVRLFAQRQTRLDSIAAVARSSDLMLGTLRIDYERDDDDELHRERTGSRTRFTAGKYES